MAEFQSIVHVTWKGLQAGQNCVNVLSYARDELNTAITSQQVAVAAYEQHWEPWKELVTSQFRMVNVTGQYAQYDPLIVKTPFVRGIDETGEIGDSESLGPNVVLNMVKYPNAATLFPDDHHPFKNGRAGFSGIPENAQNNGFVTGAAATSWSELFETMESLEITVGGTPKVYNLCMVRLQEQAIPPDTGHTYVYVEETGNAQQLGTRNSRKITL